MSLLSIICLALAGFATFLAWRTPMRLLGLMIAVTSPVSELPRHTLSLDGRIGLEVACSVLIFACAIVLWTERGGRPYFIAAMLASLDVMFCGAVSAASILLGGHLRPLKILFDYGVNLIFYAQLVCVVTPRAGNEWVAWIDRVRHHRVEDAEHPDAAFLLRRLDKHDK